MKIDSQRMREGMTIRVYDSEQALELLSALEEENWRWFSGNRIFYYQNRLLKNIRGICIKDCERRLITYCPSETVKIMLSVCKDIVDFHDVIFDDEVSEDLPDIDLSGFLE